MPYTQSLNPGNLNSELGRHSGWLGQLILPLITYPPVNGAYTEFFAGLSPDVKTIKQNEWGELMRMLRSCDCANSSSYSLRTRRAAATGSSRCRP